MLVVNGLRRSAMANQLKKYSESTFESIKHFNAIGQEYWSARELFIVLEYKKWDKFVNVIKKA